MGGFLMGSGALQNKRAKEKSGQEVKIKIN
jgi:hypothetical protein